ncbi:hypothetical protein ACFY5F_36000 [Streptomyces sp. NPDC013161]|uniref:hypothetical protein n=1 Tax=Streptomyces sp. NPDC013161 TaxID=3364862 RepID=UPI0036737F66
MSTDDATVGALLSGLRRFLASEAIDDQLWDDLDAVLGEFAPPPSREIPAITARFRTAATRLVEVVPRLVRPYPLRPMRHLIFLSTEHPRPENAQGHLNRFAMGILMVLELMRDDAL